MADVDVRLKDTMRSLRIKFGYTQEESAKLLGVSAVTLRGWESESGKITFTCIKKIEKLYKTKQEYIFSNCAVDIPEHDKYAMTQAAIFDS